MQNAFDDRRATGTPIVYWLFDAPFLNGRDLRGLPNRERRHLLAAALGDGTDSVRFSTAFEGDPRPILAGACRQGMEGLIAKRADAAYVSTRSRSWLKLKCKCRQEFVVAGFTDRADDRAQVGSLLLGIYQDGTLLSVGSVGTGRQAAALRKQLVAFEQKTCPFAAGLGKPGRWSRRAAGTEHWIEPVIVAEVEFAEITPDGQVPHPSFVGLREDKEAKAVVRELGL